MGSQDGTGTFSIEDDGATLHLTGNLWKQIAFSYTIRENTVIEFDFSSATQGEIHSIGFDNDLSITAGSAFTFHVYGSQNWGWQN